MISELFSKKIYILLFAICFVTGIKLYASSLNYFFFQDDFFEINISQTHAFKSYLEFYKFRDDIIAYRPISLQNYFFVSRLLFDLNPIGYRFIILIFYLMSGFLISKVIHKITKNPKIGLLTASFWLTSSIHFMSITWISAAYNIIGTFFWLLTSLLFLIYQENKKPLFYLYSIITFLITIGSFEFSITWPIIFSFYYFIFLKNNLFKTLKVFSVYIAISIVYLLLRTLLIKIPAIIEYKIILNTDSLKAFFWYFLWCFNVPEEFKKQIINYLLLFKERFLIDYWLLVLISTILTLWILTLAVLIPVYRHFKSQVTINFKLLLFAIFWFTAGISPVLLLPNHTFTMYLALSSIGIYLAISYLLVKNSQPVVTVAVIILFLMSSFETVRFYKNNSWMIESQKFSRNFSEKIRQEYPLLPPNSIVLFPLVENESRQALLHSNALQAIYDDASLTIYYNKSDLIKDTQNKNKRPIYLFP